MEGIEMYFLRYPNINQDFRVFLTVIFSHAYESIVCPGTERMKLRNPSLGLLLVFATGLGHTAYLNLSCCLLTECLPGNSKDKQ